MTTYRFHPHPPLPGEVVSHGDLGPWNTVYRDGAPVAFIPLAPPAQLAQAGFDPLPDSPERLRLFGEPETGK